MSDTKGPIVYDSIYIKCPKYANPQRQSRSVVIYGWEFEGNGMGVCSGVIKIFCNSIVIMVEQLCEYTKNTELYILKGWIIWYVKYISKNYTSKNQLLYFCSLFCYIDLCVLVQLNSKTKILFKNGQRTWIDISSKKKYRWPTDTWKDGQHH